MTCTYIGEFASRCTCTKPAVAGKSYCEDHIFLVYQKGSANGKRKKDMRKADAIRNLISDFNAAVEELENEGYDFSLDTWDNELTL